MTVGPSALFFQLLGRMVGPSLVQRPGFHQRVENALIF